MTAGERALKKIKASEAKFRAKDFIGSPILLDDAANILKRAGQWTDESTCAKIDSLRTRMAELAGAKA